MRSFKASLILIHIALGILLNKFSFLSTYFAFLIIVLGSYAILFKKDPLRKYPLLFISYIVGIEVLLRMTGAKIFWEFGKYALIYFLILALLRYQRRINFYLPILFYFILLLPSIVFIPMDSFSFFRQNLAFNLSGPFALFLCSTYFYNRSINKQILGEILFSLILPVLTMAVYNFMTMPNLSTYIFVPYSDISTSGGYGPNQVSCMFGLGAVSILIGQVLKLELFPYKYLGLIILVIFFGLGLITFSRGGMLAALISFLIGICYYLFNDQSKMQLLLKSLGLFGASLIAWFIVLSVTDGVIQQRYGFSNSVGGDNFVLDLSGRGLIYEIDFKIFYDYFFKGVGPGQANNLRAAYGYSGKVSAHTEYSRMLAEHGILGFFSLICFIFSIYFNLNKYDLNYGKFVKIIFGALALLTMAHSAMRIAMPSYLFSFIMFKYSK